MVKMKNCTENHGKNYNLTVGRTYVHLEWALDRPRNAVKTTCGSRVRNTAFRRARRNYACLILLDNGCRRNVPDARFALKQ